MEADFEWLSLDGDESVVWWGQPRLRRILPTVAKSAVWVTAFVAVAVLGPRYIPRFVPVPVPVPDLVIVGGGLLLAVLSAWPALRAHLQTRNVYYVLTDRNVYRKRGVLSTTVSRIGAGNVQNTRLKKDFLGNLFDYGTVEISTAGSGGTELTVTDLDDPETFRDELRRVTNERRPRAGGTTAAATRGALDAASVDTLLTDARAMRETAERLAGRVVDG
ncbi:MAG: PH domain-containing protein [Haloferacaceae archaeon]